MIQRVDQAARSSCLIGPGANVVVKEEALGPFLAGLDVTTQT